MDELAVADTRAANAALMVLLMDEQDASGLLSRLTPLELGVLGRQMCDLGDVAPEQIATAIADFAAEAHREGLPAHDRVERVRSMMSGAVGEVRADNLMRRILPEEQQRPSSIELARWLNADVIVSLISEELPQAIAVLLVQLDPQVAATVLTGLPEEVQPDVVHRVATLGRVSPAALTMLEDLVETRITECYGTLPVHMGGMREAAEIINSSSRGFEKRVMPAIGKRDKKLAQALESEMFRFEHLFTLEARMMGQLLREVNSDLLIDALKGIAEDQRDHFFQAMSSRAADGLKDEIESRGRIKMGDVLAAQDQIIAIARKLAAEGTITFGGGDEDYV